MTRSGCGPTTVNGNDSSVDELCFAGTEVADERGDILRSAETPDGLAGDEFGANFFFLVGVIFVEVAFHEWCLDGSGSDAVDAEFLWIVDGDLTSQRLNRTFAGAVGKALLDANGASDRTNVDDRAVRCEEQREGSLGDEEDAMHVDEHDTSEVFFGGAGDVADEAYAGVVDEDVEARDVREGSGDGGGVRDVHCNGCSVRQLGGEGLGRGEIEVGNEDVGTSAREFTSGGGTDAAGSSGDESDLIFQVKGISHRLKYRLDYMKRIPLFTRWDFRKMMDDRGGSVIWYEKQGPGTHGAFGW